MPDISALRQFLPTVSVGMLAADLGVLQSEATRLERAGVKMLYFDVMDGCFTPMLTFVAAGADLITIHIESCTHVHRVLQRLGTERQPRVARGIALNAGDQKMISSIRRRVPEANARSMLREVRKAAEASQVRRPC
jgi:pentose-5-phosphate-3-epimerase